MTTRWALLLLPAALAMAPMASAAEPATTAERTLARSLFEQARSLARDGKFVEACPKFEESARLAPGIGTSFNLGDCLEHTGRLASAWSAFTDAADQARRAGQEDRETAARARASVLAPRLSKIELSTAPPLPPGFTVTLDGRVLGAAVLRSPLPVDPGDHLVRASAPEKLSVELPVHVADGSRLQQVEIPALAPAPPPATTALVSSDRVASPSPDQPSAGFGWQKTSALAAGGLAVVGLGLASYFAAHAHGQWSDVASQCPANICTPAGYQGWEDARSSARVSTALFISAGVVAVGGVVLWLTAPAPGHEEPRPTARLARNEDRR